MSDARELLRRAETSFQSVKLECDAWYDVDVLNLLMTQWAAGLHSPAVDELPTWSDESTAEHHKGAVLPPASPMSFVARDAVGQQPETAQSEVNDTLMLHHDWRVWWRRPDCWRDDVTWDAGAAHVNIACEGRSIHTDTAATGDASAGRPHRSVGWFSQTRTALARLFGDAAHLAQSGNATTLEEYVAQMPLLSAGGLTQGWLLELLGQQPFAGRSAIRVRAVWQPGAAAFGHWSYIHHYDLLVDLAYGIILRCAARADDNEVAVLAVRAVEFDEPIDDAVFLARSMV